MSDSDAAPPDEWSALGTVRGFDTGFNISSREKITTLERTRHVVNSIFIESLVDQLCKLLDKDPLKQRKIYEVICAKLSEMKLIEDTYHFEELASLRGQYQQALVSLISNESRICQLPPLNFGLSRYSTEYEEICFISAGGFGKVFKARNRLDQVIYAVKKISLKYQNVSAFIKKLGEVKTLAKLNHSNIVQYKAAWLEPLFNSTPAVPSPDITTLSSNDSDEVVFQNSNSSSSHQSSENKQNCVDLAVCQFKRTTLSIQQKSFPKIGAMLYVSMQLCDETLREWLNRRNTFKEVDMPLSIGIMIQAAAGVEYIHSCNIVHHDIKPSNIFVSNDLKSVQVGDFGLSCCLQGHSHEECPLEGGHLGTPLYAAPEQLRSRCNPKSDMYSLGLVFIELVTSFSTEMERVNVLSKVRTGFLPPTLPLSLLPIIKELTSVSPDARPTASQLVERLQRFDDKPTEFKLSLSVTKPRLMSLSESSEDGIPALDQDEEVNEEDISVIELKEMIKDKDREIDELKRMLAQRDDEIAKLKQSEGILS